MEILNTLIYMLNEMSPYILLGFLVAGLMHGFIPPSAMNRHLSRGGWRSVVKGALLGIPLPLCSCGVLPAGVALHRAGASREATSAFLISTPQTGVDSIAATYSMLGPAFAILRPVAALVTALGGGMAVSYLGGKDTTQTCGSTEVENTKTSFLARLKESLYYGFYLMVQSIGKWLVIGLVIAVLITIFMPENFLAGLGRHPWLAMICVVLISVPMYVCATGSIPIALSLMLKGLSPGAALVLLMAGPAANVASMAVIGRNLGRRCATVYLGTIVVSAMAFGLMVDYLLPSEWFVPGAAAAGAHCHGALPWFPTLCSVILVTLLLIAFFPRKNKNLINSQSDMATEYKINGMSCAHCKATVEKCLSALEGVKAVNVDLGRGIAVVDGNHDREAAIRSIRDAGFEPVE